MTKGCDIEKNIDIKENPVHVTKERSSISQKLISNSNSSSKSNTECITKLKKVRINNIKNVIIATLNVNSLVSKFDELKVIGQGILDILIINETKLDASFPVNQFFINGFSTPYRLDRNRNGGGIIIYVREDITSKMLTKHKFPDDIEALFVEINFRKCKWLLCGLYHPPSQSDQYFFDNLDKALDVYSTYEKVLITGDFNAQEGEKCLDTFLYQHELKSLNKEATCYKNPNKPSCIDLILTNSPRSFFNTETYFTGLSDCHKLVLSVFKTTFSKTGPKEIMYRD